MYCMYVCNMYKVINFERNSCKYFYVGFKNLNKIVVCIRNKGVD